MARSQRLISRSPPNSLLSASRIACLTRVMSIAVVLRGIVEGLDDSRPPESDFGVILRLSPATLGLLNDSETTRSTGSTESGFILEMETHRRLSYCENMANQS